jgi:hypothetical protein
MCESPLYTNKFLRVLKCRGSITTLQTCQDSADHVHLLFFFTMLLHGLHNVKEALQYDFSLKYKSRGGQVLRNGQKPNQHDDHEST